jgi:hypothetical protein
MVAELDDFESFGLIFQDGILTVENPVSVIKVASSVKSLASA